MPLHCTLARVPSTQYPAIIVPFFLSVHQSSNNSLLSPDCIIPGLAITTEGPISSKWSILYNTHTIDVYNQFKWSVRLVKWLHSIVVSVAYSITSDLSPQCKDNSRSVVSFVKGLYNYLLVSVLVVSAVHFAPYLTSLSGMMLIWAARARCKWRAHLHNRMLW